MENIANAMNWLAMTSEITNKEVLTNAILLRREIYKKLLDDDVRIAQHFWEISLRAIEIAKERL